MAEYLIEMTHTHYQKVEDRYELSFDEEEIKEYCIANNRDPNNTFDFQEAMRFMAKEQIEAGMWDYESSEVSDHNNGDTKFIETGIYKLDEEEDA